MAPELNLAQPEDLALGPLVLAPQEIAQVVVEAMEIALETSPPPVEAQTVVTAPEPSNSGRI